MQCIDLNKFNLHYFLGIFSAIFDKTDSNFHLISQTILLFLKIKVKHSQEQ
jgi:hypothetical protein